MRRRELLADGAKGIAAGLVAACTPRAQRRPAPETELPPLVVDAERVRRPGQGLAPWSHRWHRGSRYERRTACRLRLSATVRALGLYRVKND